MTYVPDADRLKAMELELAIYKRRQELALVELDKLEQKLGGEVGAYASQMAKAASILRGTV